MTGGRIVVPSRGPACWRALLAQPERQWVEGRSAQALATCWEGADGLPQEIAALLGPGATLLLAKPEHKTPLPGGRRESQSDLLALVSVEGALVVACIEGKVDEPFGPTVSEWLVGASEGKRKRLAALSALLGWDAAPGDVRYQLMHRTAAAIIEARRFHAGGAAMLVHSFSPTAAWRADFDRFLAVFAHSEPSNGGARVTLADGLPLTLGWAAAELAGSGSSSR